MEQENQSGELERLFKKVFERQEDSPTPEAWNTPSDQVWENVFDHIKTKPGRKIGVLYWRSIAIIALVLLSVSIGILTKYCQKIEEMSVQLNRTERILRDLTSAPQQVINSISEKRNHHLAAGNTPQIASAAKPPVRPLASTHKSRSLPRITPLPTAKNKKIQVTPLRSAISIPPSIPTLRNGALIVPEPQHQLMPIDLHQTESFAHWYGGIYYAPILALRTPKPPFGRPLLTQEQQTYTFATGIQLGLQISKRWSFESGMEYLNTRREMQHTPRIRFNRMNENLNLSGNLESTYNITLRSSSNDAVTDLVFARDPRSILPDGSKVDLKVLTSSRSSRIGIPLSIRYQHQLGPWHLGLRAGILGSFLLEHKFMVKAVEAEADELVFQKSIVRTPGPLRTFTSFSLEYTAGMDFEYQFSPNWSLLFQPTFTTASKPLFEDENNKIFQQSIRLQTGIRYRLR